MKKCLLIFALPALLSSSLLAQTIPPNEIRPSATSGQVLTTVTGGTPPSWQPGASATGTAPITVNGVSGTPETTPLTIACPECGAGAFASQVVVPVVPGQNTILITAGSVNVVPVSGVNAASGSLTSAQFNSPPCNASSPPCSLVPGASVTWSNFALPAGITQSNLVNVQVYVQASQTSVNGPAGLAGNLAGCQVGTTGPTANFGSLLSGNSFTLTSTINNFNSTVTAAEVPQITCLGANSILEFGGPANSNIFNIGLLVTYTGSPIANPNTISIAPPLTLNTASNILGFTPNYTYGGTSSGSSDAYAVTLPALVMSLESPNLPPLPGQEILFTPNFSNSTTSPSLNLNGSGGVTITRTPGHSAVAAGDLNGNVADVIFDGNNWELQNPQTSSGSSGSISVNGTSVSSPNLNGTTPAAPSGSTNCTWAVSGSSVSCSIPTTSSGGVTLTGPVTGSGTGTIATTITPTGVTAGSYTNPNITLNAAGQVTAASNGSGASGITQLTGDATAGPGSGSQALTAVNLPGHIALTGTPSAGQVPTATSGSAATWQTPGGSSGSGAGIVTYSGPSLTFTGTAFFPIGGGGLSSTTETNVDLASPASATIKNFTVQLSASPGTGNSIAFTWRDNSTSTAITCTVSGSATSCSDLTDSFTASAGDLLDIQAVTAGTILSASTAVMGTQVGIASSGGGVTGGSLAISSGTQAANSCASVATVTDTGLATSGANSRPTIAYTGSTAGLTGWDAASPGMKLNFFVSSANTMGYEICNYSSSSIAYSAITFQLGAS